MKKIVIVILLLFLQYLPGEAQIITADPPLPTANDPVTIYFDATKGTQGLLNYTGDVYAHTGVLLESSTGGSDWKYVKTNWCENTPDTKLTRISANLYSLDIGPSIRDYYGVHESQTITHIAFVFRNENGTKTGKDEGGTDIFYEVFEEGLQVKIIYPEEEVSVVKQNNLLRFEAAANEADTMVIYLNGEFRKGVGPLNRITDTLPTGEYGEYTVTVWAAGQQDEKTDSFTYLVRSEPVVEDMPEGVTEGINYLSETSVILSFFAPGKEYVFVVGDFSQWNPCLDFYMKKTPDGDHFWIRIDDLDPEKVYRFYYLVDWKLSVPDPNTELLLEPAWDKYISEATFPGITALLSGLPAHRQFSVFRTGRESYLWQTGEFTPPEKTDLVIYELLLRDFLATHDWKTLTDTLDYLEQLGVNAIELMPFNEFTGNESWGYNPIYWMCPDKYYGPEEDLNAFVDECHSRGMAVIQDIVFNHVDNQSTYMWMYEDQNGFPSAENPWLNEDYDKNDPNGWYQARHPYSVFFDIDHSSIYTQQLIDRSTRYWMEEYRIDGFRFDLTKGFTQKSAYLGTDGSGNAIYDEGEASAYDAQRIGFLKRMADSIWAFREDAYVILEHFCDNTEERELANYGMMIWGNSNYNYAEAAMSYNQGSNSDFSWISYKKRGWNDPHVVGYMESHDEERLMYKMLTWGKSADGYSTKELYTALERMELAGAFFFTIPGPKLIWQFGELGYDYSIDYDCRVCNKPIRWDYFDAGRRRKLYQVWSALIRLKTGEPAFRSSDFTLSLSGEVKRISIDHEDMDVRVIGNFDVVEQSQNLSFSRTGWWYDFFGRDSIQVNDLTVSVPLQPGEFRVYTTKKLQDPGITAGVPDRESAGAGFHIYPNPGSGWVHMEPWYGDAVIRVYDMQGKLVVETIMAGGDTSLDLSVLRSGVYMISRQAGTDAPHFARVIKTTD